MIYIKESPSHPPLILTYSFLTYTFNQVDITDNRDHPRPKAPLTLLEFFHPL